MNERSKEIKMITIERKRGEKKREKL